MGFLYEQAKSTHLKGFPDLALIGVPDKFLEREPLIISYPKRFAESARPLWIKTLNDPTVNRMMREAQSLDEKWQIAIQEFLDKCEEEGMYPFTNSTQQDRNDAAIEYLKAARIDLILFMNQTDLLTTRFRVRSACRDYFVKENGLRVVAWAECKNTGSLENEQLLTNLPHRFYRTADKRLIRQVRPNAFFWVRFVNNARLHIGYEISVATPVQVPRKNVPTKKETYKFIDQVIWTPLIRAHRFKGVMNRLF